MSTYKIPSSASQALTISRYELLLYLRSKKILGIVAITIMVAVGFIVSYEFLGALGTEALGFDIASPISFVFFLITIIAAFFGSNSIMTEFNQRTGQLLFSNPVTRTSIWFGKFIASIVIAFSVIALYYSIIVSYAAISHEVPIQILSSLLFSFVSTTMIMSFAFLISSIFRGQTGAAALVFALFIIVFPMVDGVMALLSDERPWFTPTFSSGIITHVLTNFTDQNTMSNSFFGTSLVPKIADSLGIMISYIVASSALSIFIFKRRDVG